MPTEVVWIELDGTHAWVLQRMAMMSHGGWTAKQADDVSEALLAAGVETPPDRKLLRFANLILGAR